MNNQYFQRRIGRGLFYSFVGLLCFFYAAIFTASLLGIWDAYRPFLVYPVVFFAATGLFAALKHFGLDEFYSTKITHNNTHSGSLPGSVLYAATIMVIALVILLPVIRWPQSIAGDWFPWDAGVYHFPKAVELFRTGSVNDMTIAYGEYPFGYEAILALGLTIGGADQFFGLMHALIDVFFILAVWLLTRRYTSIHPALLLLLTTVMILSDRWISFMNFWRVFLAEIHTVGKNDLFLASAVLSAALFFPFPGKRSDIKPALLPFCAASMIALAIKPNSFYVIVPLWLMVFIVLIFGSAREAQSDRYKISPDLIFFLLTSSVILPGVIWLARNFFLTGEIFSEVALANAQWSIAANLTNPFFYRYIPKNLIAIVLITISMIIISLRLRPLYRWQVCILACLLFGFILTPVSAFFSRTDVPADINWRFGEAMLAYLFVVILMILDKPIASLTHSAGQLRYAEATHVILIVALAIGTLLSFREALMNKSENAMINKDQFMMPVGEGGYHSAYDYVRKNIRNATVWVENGLPYFVYGEGYTNTVSRKNSADYIVAIKEDAFGEPGITVPSYFSKNWQSNYEIVYEDEKGIVYHRLD